MNERENLVVDTTAENTEITVEETPKTYTEAEFNAKLDEVLGKKIARREAKIRKEYDRKYSRLEEVLKAGTGKNSVEEVTESLEDFYSKKGISVARKPELSAKQIETLAKAEADDIIASGYEEVADEVDRLAAIGAEKMSAEEKVLFRILAEHRQSMERGRELNKIGVTEDVYNSKEFREFASKFNTNTPIKDVYDIYAKTLPKKEFKTMGSMKNDNSGDNGVKEFYTLDEARKFTQSDFDKNPALFAAVQKSMTKWK